MPREIETEAVCGEIFWLYSNTNYANEVNGTLFPHCMKRVKKAEYCTKFGNLRNHIGFYVF